METVHEHGFTGDELLSQLEELDEHWVANAVAEFHVDGFPTLDREDAADLAHSGFLLSVPTLDGEAAQMQGPVTEAASDVAVAAVLGSSGALTTAAASGGTPRSRRSHGGTRGSQKCRVDGCDTPFVARGSGLGRFDHHNVVPDPVDPTNPRRSCWLQCTWLMYCEHERSGSRVSWIDQPHDSEGRYPAIGASQCKLQKPGQCTRYILPHAPHQSRCCVNHLRPLWWTNEAACMWLSSSWSRSSCSPCLPLAPLPVPSVAPEGAAASPVPSYAAASSVSAVTLATAITGATAATSTTSTAAERAAIPIATTASNTLGCTPIIATTAHFVDAVGSPTTSTALMSTRVQARAVPADQQGSTTVQARATAAVVAAVPMDTPVAHASQGAAAEGAGDAEDDAGDAGWPDEHSPDDDVQQDDDSAAPPANADSNQQATQPTAPADADHVETQPAVPADADHIEPALGAMLFGFPPHIQADVRRTLADNQVFTVEVAKCLTEAHMLSMQLSMGVRAKLLCALHPPAPPPPPPPPPLPPAMSSTRYRIGSRVLVAFADGDYAGTVTNVSGADGATVYSIDFDDGDRAKDVKENEMRTMLDAREAPPPRTPAERLPRSSVVSTPAKAKRASPKKRRHTSAANPPSRVRAIEFHEPLRAPRCGANHAMQRQRFKGTEKVKHMHCDDPGCDRAPIYDGSDIWSCEECDFDLCWSCATRRVALEDSVCLSRCARAVGCRALARDVRTKAREPRPQSPGS